ncbi:MAG: hypothetical protein Kow0077_22730 [Anaerolineae bacterium]
MSEPQQLCLLPEAEGKKLNRSVEYVPPNTDLIRQYAHKVCRRLSEQEDQDFTGTEFTRGLTNFMQVVAQIQARHLSRGGRYVQE